MNKYKAMFIFLESLKEDGLKATLAKIQKDIEEFGGTVNEIRELGRKQFARPLKKKNAGNYIEMFFDMDPSKLKDFDRRCKLNDDIFRVMVTKFVELKKPKED